MTHFFRSRQAEQDLFDLFSMIAVDDPSAAVRMIDRFDEVFRRLADHPQIGEQHRTGRRRDVRIFPVGNYVVFYRAVAGGVLIMRIYHAARGDSPEL